MVVEGIATLRAPAERRAVLAALAALAKKYDGWDVSGSDPAGSATYGLLEIAVRRWLLP